VKEESKKIGIEYSDRKTITADAVVRKSDDEDDEDDVDTEELMLRLMIRQLPRPMNRQRKKPKMKRRMVSSKYLVR
jgi:hypothetical protein